MPSEEQLEKARQAYEEARKMNDNTRLGVVDLQCTSEESDAITSTEEIVRLRSLLSVFSITPNVEPCATNRSAEELKNRIAAVRAGIQLHIPLQPIPKESAHIVHLNFGYEDGEKLLALQELHIDRNIQSFVRSLVHTMMRGDVHEVPNAISLSLSIPLGVADELVKRIDGGSTDVKTQLLKYVAAGMQLEQLIRPFIPHNNGEPRFY